MTNTFVRKFSISASVVLALQTIMFLASAQAGAAGNLTSTYIRLDRMKTAVATNFRVVFTTSSGTATENKLKISFNDAFTVATSGITSSVASCPTETSTTALPGTFTFTSSNTNGSKNITVGGLTNLTASAAYCIDITGSPITNAVAGQYKTPIETEDSGSVQIDFTQIALRIIADDQIVVTATVPPTFAFTLSGNTDTFATDLDPLAVLSSNGARTVTIATNAPGGWVTWVKDLNQGLKSAIAGNYTIATAGTVNGAPSTLSAGTEGYVLDTNLTTDAAGGCTLTIDPEYNGVGANDGGTLSATFQPIASCSGGTANNDVVTLVEKVAIAGVTPAAGDYTDTLTVVGAARF